MGVLIDNKVFLFVLCKQKYIVLLTKNVFQIQIKNQPSNKNRFQYVLVYIQ